MNEKWPGIMKYYLPVFLLIVFYLFISEIAQTLLFTVVTYIVTTAGKEGADFSNTVNEIASQYFLFSFALGALVVTISTWLGDKALYKHLSFWNDSRKPIWQLDKVTKEELLRGLASGFIIAALYLLIFTTSKQVSFLGIYITSTLGTPVFPLFVIDLISLIALVVCEEFIFRHKILRYLLQNHSQGTSILISSLLYLLAKHLQFQLTGMDYINFFILNLTVGFFFTKSLKAHRGLGFLIALFCVLHPLAGLPLWGTESPSFFLFKTTARASETLSGGNAGPFAGLGLFSILLVYTLGARLSWKRSDKKY